ncbi:hypothetical protein PAJ34TS1_39560 [Paenibacillus azoreducens]|uniref:Uncharacterized protein n=1 Tax=Paenibacillus azoreducens TaxID=116718 RepID=A0A919Y6I4_9BACL|nr:hypothetical protein J34TS1_03370 [Paenibacillus azoreducens]
MRDEEASNTVSAQSDRAIVRRVHSNMSRSKRSDRDKDEMSREEHTKNDA